MNGAIAMADLMRNTLEIAQAPAPVVRGGLARSREMDGGGQLLRSELLYAVPRRQRRRRSVYRVVARRKKNLVFLDPEKIWAFEAAERLTFVHSPEGKFAIDLSLAAIEALLGRPFFRVHRNWLVNLAYVKELERVIGGATLTVGSDLELEGRSIRAPVSQNRARAVRKVLLMNAAGLRHP